MLSGVERARYYSVVFCFSVLEDSPESWSSQGTGARSVKPPACSWTEPCEPDAKPLGVAPERSFELGG